MARARSAELERIAATLDARTDARAAEAARADAAESARAEATALDPMAPHAPGDAPAPAPAPAQRPEPRHAPHVKPPLASDGHPGVGGRYPEPDGHPGVGPAYSVEREAREPDASAVPEGTEAFLRAHLGDEIYGQILHDDIPGMAELMGLDPDLVEAAGPAAAAAIAGTVASRNLPPRQRQSVNAEIVKLAEAGHGRLAFELRARVGSQHSLGADHNRYAMTNEELQAANDWDERKRDALRAMTDLPAIPPRAKVLAGLLAAAMQSNIDDRNGLIEQRNRRQ